MANLINDLGAIADEIKDELELLPSDEELNSKIVHWLEESKPYLDELNQYRRKSESYYLGDQTEKRLIPRGLSNIVINRIFESVETIVPMVTSRPSEFIAKSRDQSELGVIKAKKIQRTLSDLYEKLVVGQKIEESARHALLYRNGVLKLFWDDEYDEMGLKAVRPQRILVPRYGGRFVCDSPYVIEKIDMTWQEIKNFFGEDIANSLSLLAHDDDKDEKDPQSRVWTINEVWTNYWRAYQYGNKILKKEKNPYFNFEDTKGNFLDRPIKPYFFLAPFALGKSPIPETSKVEQAIPIQDGINSIARVIINHSNKTANAQTLVDSSTMSKEEADSISNAPSITVYGNGVANANLFRRDAPPPLPAYLFETWNQLHRALDNLFGTHSTTRGEREGRETFRGRVFLKQADIGRLDYIIREIDRTIQEMGTYMVQMIKMFYAENREIKFLGVSGDFDVFSISHEDVEPGMQILVKAGSTLPQDDASEADKAIQLWQLGAIDPITLYEKLQFPNPMESAEKLMKWKAGVLIPIEQPTPGVAPQGGGAVGLPSPMKGLGAMGGMENAI